MRQAWKQRRKKKECRVWKGRDKIEEKCSVRMIASRKAEIINMAIFLLSLGEQRTKEETGRRRMVGKVKNLVNIKKERERERGESGDKESDGRKDRSGKEKDIRTLPPCVQSLR